MTSDTFKTFLQFLAWAFALSTGVAWADTDPQLKKLEDELQSARRNLRLSQATERKIEQDMQELESRQGIDPKILADYRIYLERVRGLLTQHEQMVRKMEAVYDKVAPKKTEPASPENFTPSIPEQVDELAALERELNASLAKFDDYINQQMADAQKRMEVLSEIGEEERNDMASEAADAVRRLRERGIDVETELPEGGTGEQEEKEGMSETEAEPEGDNRTEKPEREEGENESSRETKSDESTPETSVESDQSGLGNPGAETSNRKTLPKNGSTDSSAGQGPDSVLEPSGSGGSAAADNQGTIRPRSNSRGDDIVARQLREAAEKETDPELKEKLWKEYEDYRKGL